MRLSLPIALVLIAATPAFAADPVRVRQVQMADG
jgi:hypothetical protein